MNLAGLLSSDAVLDAAYHWPLSGYYSGHLPGMPSPSGFGIAHKTVERRVEKMSRLYEQGADEQRIETDLKHG